MEKDNKRKMHPLEVMHEKKKVLHAYIRSGCKDVELEKALEATGLKFGKPIKHKAC